MIKTKVIYILKIVFFFYYYCSSDNESPKSEKTQTYDPNSKVNRKYKHLV